MRYFWLVFATFLTYLCVPDRAKADPTMEELSALCASADKLSRGAAAFGCDVVRTMKSEVEDNFADFLEHGCAQAATVATFESCSRQSDAVSFGYKLRCKEVMQSCGCDTKDCLSPGAIKYGAYDVEEGAGKSCDDPIIVSAPPNLMWTLVDLWIGWQRAIAQGSSLHEFLKDIADPSGDLYAQERDILALKLQLEDVPLDKAVVLQFGNGGQSPCYRKVQSGDYWLLVRKDT